MLPVGDFLRRRTTPYVNWTLIAINIAIFVYTVSLNSGEDQRAGGLVVTEAERFLFDWGFVPACVADYLGIGTDADPSALASACPQSNNEPIQLVTSMFLHGGWAHILGNMLFLWIFGDNVEDRMGHARYLIFYLVCGLLAAVTETYMATDSVVPTVGASGAIAGVLGAYFILHPTARVQVIILPLFFLPFFVPAVVLIGIWFAMQLISGFQEIGSSAASSGIAFWAHVGGFVAGLVLVWFFKGSRRPLRES